MRVKSIKLKNFRNYDEASLEFFAGINLIAGQNGQGKTNLVEAVMLNALSKSPRTSHDEDMKKEGTSHTEAEVLIERDFGEVSVKCVLDSDAGKKFFVNTNEIKKTSELFGNLVAVYFAPNDLKIVSESPAERRDFMDTDISQLSGSYYTLLSRYNKVLFQRNRLLKTVHDKNLLKDQIDVWNEQLASLASMIIRTRKNFIAKLSEPANETIKYITKDAMENHQTAQHRATYAPLYSTRYGNFEMMEEAHQALASDYLTDINSQITAVHKKIQEMKKSLFKKQAELEDKKLELNGYNNQPGA